MVVDGDSWHRGVIGICATRVVERYCRPALVFSCENGEAHGSGRSIECVSSAGGAGVVPRTVHPFRRALLTPWAARCRSDRFPQLRARLDAYARQRLTPEDFVPAFEYDAEVAATTSSTTSGWRCRNWSRLVSGNPTPVFVARNARLVQPPRGS